MNILTNSDFSGMVEKPSRKNFCPGWKISFAGSPSDNKYDCKYEGNGLSRRLVITVNELEKWFRIYQLFKLEEGVESLGLSITSALAESINAESAIRIRVMRVATRYSFVTAASIDTKYSIPQSPQTSDYSVDVSGLDKSEQYAVVLEFERPTSIALWSVALTQYDRRQNTLVPSQFKQVLTDASRRSGIVSVADTEVCSLANENSDRSSYRDSLHSHMMLTTFQKYESRIERLKNNELIGWFASTKNPSKVFTAELYIDGLLYGELRNDVSRPDLLKNHKTMGQGGFRLKIHKRLFTKRKYTFSLKYPDNTFSKSQVIELSNEYEQTKSFRGNLVDNEEINGIGVTVIVPVYNAFNDVVECVEKLRLNTPKSVNILFINDQSSDSRISPFLDELDGVENFKVLNNESNMGFTKTVNRGIGHAVGQDVVFLNSDARVTPGWIQSLCAVANMYPNVATVTPLSDNAGAFSAPDFGQFNALKGGGTEDEFAELVRRNSAGICPEIPTGNGFCLYVRRSCIDEIGMLDEESFPRGYGEENDFCMRALRAGWVHLLDDSTYVFHERSASFGEEKTDLIKRSKAIIHERYPEYAQLVKSFKSPAMNLVRYRVRIAQNEASSTGLQLPRALYVYSGLTGGTPQTNRDLMRGLNGVLDTWTLRCDSQFIFLERFDGKSSETIETHELEEVINPLTHISIEYDKVVQAWLKKYRFKLVHIRHLLWHSISLPKLAKISGCDVVLSFHDFYTICPTVKLLDGESNYCAGDCSKGSGSCLADSWQGVNFPNLRNEWVVQWRSMFGKTFDYVDAFVTTSRSAADTMSKAYPGIKSRLSVIPHGRDLARGSSSYIQPQIGEVIRVLVPGNISIAKGLKVIKDLVEVDRSSRLEFHILGKVSSEIVLPDSVIVHGIYTRDDLLEKINNIAPTVGAVFSIWDETYCHTLTEMWSAGLPVIVFDYGTLATRVNESGAGWVLDHSSIPKLYENIVRSVENFDDYNAKRLAAAKWQNTVGLVNSSSLMALKYLNVYQSLNSEDGEVDGVSRLGLSSGGQRSAGANNIIAVVHDKFESIESRDSVLTLAKFSNYYGREFQYFNCSVSELVAGVETGELQSAIVLNEHIDESSSSIIKSLVDIGKLAVVELGSQGLIGSSSLIASAGDVSNLEYSPSAQLMPSCCWANVDSRRTNYRHRDVVAIYFVDDIFVSGSNVGKQNTELLFIIDEFRRATLEVPNLKLKVVGPSGLDEGLDYEWLEYHSPHKKIDYKQYVNWVFKLTRCVDFGLSPSIEESDASLDEVVFLEMSLLGLSGLYGGSSQFEKMVKASGTGSVVKGRGSWSSAIVRAAERYQQMRVEGSHARIWAEKNRLANHNALSLFDKFVSESLSSRAKRLAA